MSPPSKSFMNNPSHISNSSFHYSSSTTTESLLNMSSHRSSQMNSDSSTNLNTRSPYSGQHSQMSSLRSSVTFSQDRRITSNSTADPRFERPLPPLPNSQLQQRLNINQYQTQYQRLSHYQQQQLQQHQQQQSNYTTPPPSAHYSQSHRKYAAPSAFPLLDASSLQSHTIFDASQTYPAGSSSPNPSISSSFHSSDPILSLPSSGLKPRSSLRPAPLKLNQRHLQSAHIPSTPPSIASTAQTTPISQRYEKHCRTLPSSPSPMSLPTYSPPFSLPPSPSISPNIPHKFVESENLAPSTSDAYLSETLRHSRSHLYNTPRAMSSSPVHRNSSIAIPNSAKKLLSSMKANRKSAGSTPRTVRFSLPDPPDSSSEYSSHYEDVEVNEAAREIIRDSDFVNDDNLDEQADYIADDDEDYNYEGEEGDDEEKDDYDEVYGEDEDEYEEKDDYDEEEEEEEEEDNDDDDDEIPPYHFVTEEDKQFLEENRNGPRDPIGQNILNYIPFPESISPPPEIDLPPCPKIRNGVVCPRFAVANKRRSGRISASPIYSPRSSPSPDNEPVPVDSPSVKLTELRRTRRESSRSDAVSRPTSKKRNINDYSSHQQQQQNSIVESCPPKIVQASPKLINTKKAPVKVKAPQSVRLGTSTDSNSKPARIKTKPKPKPVRTLVQNVRNSDKPSRASPLRESSLVTTSTSSVGCNTPTTSTYSQGGTIVNNNGFTGNSTFLLQLELFQLHISLLELQKNQTSWEVSANKRFEPKFKELSRHYQALRQAERIYLSQQNMIALRKWGWLRAGSIVNQVQDLSDMLNYVSNGAKAGSYYENVLQRFESWLKRAESLDLTSQISTTSESRVTSSSKVEKSQTTVSSTTTTISTYPSLSVLAKLQTVAHGPDPNWTVEASHLAGETVKHLEKLQSLAEAPPESPLHIIIHTCLEKLQYDLHALQIMRVLVRDMSALARHRLKAAATVSAYSRKHKKRENENVSLTTSRIKNSGDTGKSSYSHTKQSSQALSSYGSLVANTSFARVPSHHV